MWNIYKYNIKEHKADSEFFFGNFGPENYQIITDPSITQKSINKGQIVGENMT